MLILPSTIGEASIARLSTSAHYSAVTRPSARSSRPPYTGGRRERGRSSSWPKSPRVRRLGRCATTMSAHCVAASLGPRRKRYVDFRRAARRASAWTDAASA